MINSFNGKNLSENELLMVNGGTRGVSPYSYLNSSNSLSARAYRAINPICQSICSTAADYAKGKAFEYIIKALR